MIERLLVLRLESVGVAAEATLNGVPLLRTMGQGGAVTVPVHEYALAGGNELTLTLLPPETTAVELTAGTPASQPWLAEAPAAATLRLLLPRIGQRAHPEFARTVAAIEWAAPAGEVHELPKVQRRAVELPIVFPRWRWLDAPPVVDPAALAGAAAAFLQPLAIALKRGDPEPLVQAARLRFEELAQAYQTVLADDVQRFREAIRRAHAAMPLAPAMPLAAKLRLRPLAGGRLLECLDAAGESALRCPATEGATLAWPMRLAAIDGQFYVLR
jgi:hypothetical protein